VSTKGLSQQQLQGDEDHHLVALQEFLRQRWQVLAIGVLVIVTGVVAAGLVSRSRKSSEAEAHALWFRAQEDVIYGEYAAALEAAKVLDDRFSGTPSGKKAALIRGDALAAQGNLAEARTAYEQAMKTFSSDPILSTSAKRGLAVVLENEGDLARAAQLYEELGRGAFPEGGRVFDLRAAARCHRAAGANDQALAVLNEIVTTYEASEERVARDQVHLAKVAIAEWGPKPN
jgi:tetratricopeptide (TPR) repeat protein